MGMSWAMSNADVPFLILDLLNTISDNPIIILLIINIILLIIGTLWIWHRRYSILRRYFTGCHRTGHGPDSLWYCHGTEHVYRYLYSACRQCVLFVGCSVSKLPINKIIKPMLPFYAVMVLVLAMVTYIPQISMALPRALGYWCAFTGGTCRHIY